MIESYIKIFDFDFYRKMKRILQDIQREKEEEEQQKEAEKKRKIEEEKEKKEEERQLELESFKQYVLEKLNEYSDITKYMKKSMIKAAQKGEDKIHLIQLPDRDPDLFPDCSGVGGFITHDEDSCSYVEFIADVINETLDKNIFDIKLEYMGVFNAEGCIDIMVKFKV